MMRPNGSLCETQPILSPFLLLCMIYYSWLTGAHQVFNLGTPAKLFLVLRQTNRLTATRTEVALLMASLGHC